MFNTRKDILFTVLGGFFVTNAVVGELIGGKLIQLGPFTMSIGILPWPIVFLATDIINEYYGKRGVRRLSVMTAGLITYTFVVLLAGMSVRASGISPVKDEQFSAVFGQSMWIIVGSITAFTGYTAKLIIAIALTPMIYLGHSAIHAYLGKELREQIVEETANEQGRQAI
jgi:uncharacterized PurR-regulated membrane protein YhhQ (DUF165 family)